MKTFTERLKTRMKELGLTQEILAEKMEMTRGAITHYLAGRREPRLHQINKMAHILKCDPAWLQFGVTTSNSVDKNKKSIQIKTDKVFTGIPILEWNQVKHFPTTAKFSHAETKKVPCICHQNETSRFFALRLKGDAMSSPLGQTRSFQEGDILIVDPDKTETHGDYVIALTQGAKEVTFKQYVVDGGVKYLKPLNPQYPLVQIDKKVQLIGVVVARLNLLT